jgi:hypothetical protein
MQPAGAGAVTAVVDMAAAAVDTAAAVTSAEVVTSVADMVVALTLVALAAAERISPEADAISVAAGRRSRIQLAAGRRSPAPPVAAVSGLTMPPAV